MLDVRFQPMQKRPAAQPGRPFYVKASFKTRTAMDDLERELDLLKAKNIVIESGHDRTQIRNDGWPRGGSSPAHQDIRLFFTCKHGTLRYECNRFDSWEDNLRAIGLWIQRQRLALEEWGIGTGGEAYRGFAALPPGGIQLAEFASVEDAARFMLNTEGFPAPTDEDIEAVVMEPAGTFRGAAKKAHPDITRDNGELMAKLNRARDFIEKHTGARA